MVTWMILRLTYWNLELDAAVVMASPIFDALNYGGMVRRCRLNR
jgi:hypothetical protein